MTLFHSQAPEFYNHLKHHTSYCAVIYTYIFNARMGACARRGSHTRLNDT